MDKINPPQKRKRVQISFKDETPMTEQTHKQSCDINLIVKKFSETGILLHENTMEKQYGDAPDMDLKTALDLTFEHQRNFDSLTDEERSIFDHNSDNYARFLSEYEESPESFMFDQTLDDDIPLPENTNNAKNEHARPSDEV